MHISHGTHQGRHDGTAKHTTDNEARAPLGMAAQTAHSESNDGREADGLEEERQVEHAHADVAALRDGGRNENNAHCEKDAKDYPGPDEVHNAGSQEAADGEGSLSTG